MILSHRYGERMAANVCWPLLCYSTGWAGSSHEDGSESHDCYPGIGYTEVATVNPWFSLCMVCRLTQGRWFSGSSMSPSVTPPTWTGLLMLPLIHLWMVYGSRPKDSPGRQNALWLGKQLYLEPHQTYGYFNFCNSGIGMVITLQRQGPVILKLIF